MNTIGKKNVIFGFAYFLTTLAIGLYMAFAMYVGGARAQWLESPAHQLIKQAHVHGNLEALLNIVAGTLICFFGTRSLRLAKTVSVLLILAALLHSGMFYLGGLGLRAAVALAWIGPLCLIAAMALMIPIIWKGLGEKQV